jgi:hypothetical protein
MRFWLNRPFSRNIFVQKNEDIFEILFKLQVNCIMSHKRYTASQKYLSLLRVNVTLGLGRSDIQYLKRHY